jgi:hypothetical protein
MGGSRRGVYRVLVGTPEGKRPLGRPWHRWEDNINVYFKKIVWEDVNWIDLTRETDMWLAGYPGRGNELSVSINIAKLLE